MELRKTSLVKLQAIIYLLALTIMTGCGGGGGGSGDPTPTASAPAAPTPQISFGIKQLKLAWPSVNGATSYKVLENADGVSGFQQISGDLVEPTPNHVFDMTLDVAVHLYDWAHARYIVQACNAQGCSSSSEISVVEGAAKAVGYFKASDTHTADALGSSVALSGDGNTFVVGAPYRPADTSNIVTNGAGAVYVYARSDNGNWSQQARLDLTGDASFSAGSDNFGTSVAVNFDGSKIAIGAPQRESLDFFGTSGDTWCAGINCVPVTTRGRAYVYKKDPDGTWALSADIAPMDTQGWRDVYGFGNKVQLDASGSVLAVGTNAGPGLHGFAFIFRYSGETRNWYQSARLETPDLRSLALSGDGNTLAISAFGSTHNDDPNNPRSITTDGAVLVYRCNADGVWSSVGFALGLYGFEFGKSMALSFHGTTLAIGAPRATESFNNGSTTKTTHPGAVYLFSVSATSLDQFGILTSPVKRDDDTQGSNELFGHSLAAITDENDGLGMIAVGALNATANPSGIGGVYIFKSPPNTEQYRFIRPDILELNWLGLSLAFSQDGKSLLIGSPGEDSSATGIGGNQSNNGAENSGAAFLF